MRHSTALVVLVWARGARPWVATRRQEVAQHEHGRQEGIQRQAQGQRREQPVEER